ncbi:MAG: hypothetical protein H7Y18_03510 [Clostridiaceae bacterium]|nr:hypothetical protein [Clostridiaceae bacterium]
MYKKTIWLLFNVIVVVMAVVLKNSSYYFISILSNAFLYDGFLEVCRNLLEQKVTLKELYKAYIKYETPNPVALKISLQLFFGVKFIAETVIKFNYKFDINNFNKYPVDCATFVIGVCLIICLLRNVKKFDN